MTDKIKIIQDISLLYELSLSVGSSLDPRENCHNFLRTLISRKSLNFGAVWLNRITPEGDLFCDLFYIHPHFREAERTVTCSHTILKMLTGKQYLSICSQEPYFEAFVHEKNVGNGTYAIFKLGDLGFMKLFASNRPTGFSDIEMAQLKQVIDKLTISLNGCFAHTQLREETEHRLGAQKALEESEHKLRRIIDSSLDAVVSANEDGLAIEWNAQAEKMFGYTRREVIGRRLRDMFIPERHWSMFQTSFEDYLRTTNESLVNKRYEIKCVRKDGTEFLAELSVTADRNEKNILFVGFVRDITEQRKAKMDIEQARIRLETLITNLQTGILLEDDNRCIALVNRAFCDIFAIPAPPEHLIGMDCTQSAEQSKSLFIDPQGFVDSINKALKDKVLVENEVFHMCNGRILERTFIPLFSGEKYEGHLWQYRDITERQNAQRAIRESEEKYRGVLENMELGLLEVDTEDNIIRANNAFCQMLGYTPEELVGKNAAHYLLPEASRNLLQERLEERNSGVSSVYEIQLKRKNGELVWGLISGALVRNAQGQIVGSIGIQFDLTARKKMEHELAEAKLAADRARMAERQFLTHMSHEIRTPINAVIGMTHLLDDTRPSPVQQEYLNSLRFSADSLLGVIDNILDLSKIDAGEIDFEQKAFDLDYLLQALLQAFQFKIAEKDLKITAVTDPAIQTLVVGDPTRTNQILTNLLGNALKFTPSGAIHVTANMVEHHEGQYRIEFRVKDTGIGIAPDKLETIFEYFKQADVQINRKFGGTGLGLTIVKQLVEIQGGTVQVKSQLGEGSEFIITLPFGDSGIALADQALIPATDQQQPDKRINGLHILVVEDNALNQKLLCKTLASWGCTYAVANTGVEALSVSAKTPFDLILMDIHMPEMDGCDTTLAIRSNPDNPNRNTPIIALTAAAMADEKRRAAEVGMSGFLTKPIAPKNLQAYLLHILEKNTPVENALSDTTAPENIPPGSFSLNYLLELSNGDLHFVHDILQAFLTETPAELQLLYSSANTGAWDDVRKTVHKLKPNFAMLGMQHLHEQVLHIESCIQQKQPHNVLSNLTHQLIASTEALFEVIAAHKNGFLTP